MNLHLPTANVPVEADLQAPPDLADLAIEAASEIAVARRGQTNEFNELKRLVTFLDERIARPARSAQGLRHADHPTLNLVGNAVQRHCGLESVQFRDLLRKADALTQELRKLAESQRGPFSQNKLNDLKNFCLKLAQAVMDERNQSFAAFDHGFYRR